MKPGPSEYNMKLEEGRIPPHTGCPFREQCSVAERGQCYHKGVDHECAYSCAIARGFDLIERNRADV